MSRYGGVANSQPYSWICTAFACGICMQHLHAACVLPTRTSIWAPAKQSVCSWQYVGHSDKSAHMSSQLQSIIVAMLILVAITANKVVPAFRLSLLIVIGTMLVR